MFSDTEYHAIWLLYCGAAVGLSLSLGWFLAWFPFKPVVTFLRVFLLVALLVPGMVVEGDARLAPQLLSLAFDAWLVGELNPDRLVPIMAMALCIGLMASILHYGWRYWRGTQSGAQPAQAASPSNSEPHSHSG